MIDWLWMNLLYLAQVTAQRIPLALLPYGNSRNSQYDKFECILSMPVYWSTTSTTVGTNFVCGTYVVYCAAYIDRWMYFDRSRLVRGKPLIHFLFPIS
jgi:hypothetical protein